MATNPIMTNGDGTIIHVAGLPVTLGVTDNFIVSALFQNVVINGSPFIFYFDPPIASISTINPPVLVTALSSALLRGAIIQPFGA